MRNHYKGDVYNKFPGIKWFDGFDSTRHKVLHLEDVGREASTQLGFYKHWLDTYPFNVESKGSSQYIRPEVTIVTSNYHPSQLWSPEEAAAILRRVTLHKMMHPYDAVRDPKNHRNLQGPPKLRLPVLGGPCEPESMSEANVHPAVAIDELPEDEDGDLVYPPFRANPTTEVEMDFNHAHLNQDNQFQQVPNVPLVQARFNNNQIYLGHLDEDGNPMTPNQALHWQAAEAAAAAARDQEEEEASNESWWDEEMMRDEGAPIGDDELYDLFNDDD